MVSMYHPQERTHVCFAPFCGTRSRIVGAQFILIAVISLLSVTANAQLLHRYDFNSTNDTVGTANGRLVGSATLNGGALVTDGGNGTANGTWNGSGPRLTVNPTAVSGLTKAFTIETWCSCTTGWPK